MKFFIDTGFLVAIANQDDKFHKIAMDQFQGILDRNEFEITISDHVISEFLSFVLYKVSKEKALIWAEEIFEHQRFDIVFTDKNVFHKAWKIFESDDGERKPLSFVDCIILATCDSLKPDVLLSYDNRLNSMFKQLS